MRNALAIILLGIGFYSFTRRDSFVNPNTPVIEEEPIDQQDIEGTAIRVDSDGIYIQKVSPSRMSVEVDIRFQGTTRNVTLTAQAPNVRNVKLQEVINDNLFFDAIEDGNRLEVEATLEIIEEQIDTSVSIGADMMFVREKGSGKILLQVEPKGATVKASEKLKAQIIGEVSFV